MVSFQSPAGDGKPITPDPPEKHRGFRIALVLTLLILLEASPLVVACVILWACGRLHR
jgi:hypothetical protein